MELTIYYKGKNKKRYTFKIYGYAIQIRVGILIIV